MFGFNLDLPLLEWIVTIWFAGMIAFILGWGMGNRIGYFNGREDAFQIMNRYPQEGK